MNDSIQFTDPESDTRESIRAVPLSTPYAYALPPKLCSGLVRAQAAVDTVINDGRVDFGRTKYNYATQAAIAECARKALEVGGLALHVGEWRVDPTEKPVMLTATVTLLHESGECMPPYQVRMPIVGAQGASADKALAAALTNVRKYAAAAALGMGWEDADTDIEQRDVPREQRQYREQTRSRDSQRQPSVPASDADTSGSSTSEIGADRQRDPELGNAIARAIELGKRAGAAIRNLGFDGNEAYCLVSGRPTWPGRDATALDFLALHQAHAHIEDVTSPPPTTHDELLELVEDPDKTLIYARGELTSCGREMAGNLRIAV